MHHSFFDEIYGSFMALICRSIIVYICRSIIANSCRRVIAMTCRNRVILLRRSLVDFHQRPPRAFATQNKPRATVAEQVYTQLVVPPAGASPPPPCAPRVPSICSHASALYNIAYGSNPIPPKLPCSSFNASDRPLALASINYTASASITWRDRSCPIYPSVLGACGRAGTPSRCKGG